MTPHDSLQQSRSPLDKWWGVYGPALLRIKRDTEHYLAVTPLVARLSQRRSAIAPDGRRLASRSGKRLGTPERAAGAVRPWAGRVARARARAQPP